MAAAPDEPAQRDRVWMGYHPRTMAPAVAGTAVVSLLVWTGRWYLDDLSRLADQGGALVVFALAWAVWPGLLAVFLYRTVTLTYRLSDRAVFVDFGFLCRPVSPIPLAEITSVAVGGGWIGRRLGVGWVEVHAAGRAVRMPGIRDPEVFAEQIWTAARTSQTAR